VCRARHRILVDAILRCKHARDKIHLNPRGSNNDAMGHRAREPTDIRCQRSDISLVCQSINDLPRRLDRSDRFQHLYAEGCGNFGLNGMRLKGYRW